MTFNQKLQRSLAKRQKTTHKKEKTQSIETSQTDIEVRKQRH